MKKSVLISKIENASAQEADEIYKRLSALEIEPIIKKDLLFRAAQRELYMLTFGKE